MCSSADSALIMQGLLQAFARAMLDGECWTTDVATLTGINAEANIRSIEGCTRRDSARNNAAGSTDGSTAEGVSTPCYLY